MSMWPSQWIAIEAIAKIARKKVFRGFNQDFHDIGNMLVQQNLFNAKKKLQAQTEYMYHRGLHILELEIMASLGASQLSKMYRRLWYRGDHSIQFKMWRGSTVPIIIGVTFPNQCQYIMALRIHTPYSMVLQIICPDILRALWYFPEPHRGEEKCEQRVKCLQELSVKPSNKKFIIPLHDFFPFFVLLYSMSNFKPGCYSAICLLQCNKLSYFARSLLLIW